MCDTMVTITGDGVLFAKNSDRDPNEAQFLDWQSGAVHGTGERVRCTWIEIHQVRRTNATLLSRPWWMWGAEIGANEHGVVIGNEAVFTRSHEDSPGLLGMDLLRLAVERASTADEAAGIIVELLEAHGQGGSCSHEHPRFSYDNSFLIADPSTAIVLETAGRSHAVEHVRSGSRSISNALTIPDFARANADRIKGGVASGAARREITTSAGRTAESPADLMATLRSHGATAVPRYSVANGAMSAPCMHAGGLVANSQTTASWVADLRGAPLHWVTGTAAPCTSIFKPVRVEEPLALGPQPTNVFDPATLWWRHELLHRASMFDHGSLTARYAHERDRIERSWLDDPPASVVAFERADSHERQWLADVRAASTPDRRPPVVRSYWRRQDRSARLVVRPSVDHGPVGDVRAADPPPIARSA